MIDFLICSVSAVIGACLMKAAEDSKNNKLMAERERTEKWRRECQELRVQNAVLNIKASQAVSFTPEGNAPLPLTFGSNEEQELRENGCFVRSRVSVR